MLTAVHVGHYIPVTWLTLGLDHAIWGMNPLGYHLTSLVFHAASAVLVYRWPSDSSRSASPRSGPRIGWPCPSAPPLPPSLFALHPLRVESVAWVTERRDVVSGFLALASVLAYLTAARRGGRRAERTRAGWPRRRAPSSWPPSPSPSWWAFRWCCWPSTSIRCDDSPGVPWSPCWSRSSVPRGGGRRGGPCWRSPSAGASLAPIEVAGLPQRLALTGYGLAFYLGKTLWPVAPVTALYPLPPRRAALRPLSRAGAVTISLTVSLIALRRRWPAGLTAWVAYVALLLPAAGILPNGPQIAADRYSYLPMIGWAIVAGAGLPGVGAPGGPGRLTTPLARLALAATVVLLGGVRAPHATTARRLARLRGALAPRRLGGPGQRRAPLLPRLGAGRRAPLR